MKPIYLSFLLLCTLTIFSQEDSTATNTLEKQFDDIYRTSSTYQVYKVISKTKYNTLKLNVLDSLKSSKETIAKKENQLKAEKENNLKTKELLSKTQSDLDNALSKENSISIFGISLSKTSYNLIVWAVIILLMLILSYFIFKFFRSNILTKEAQSQLIETEKEFEIHRKKSLEREQKLRRQLQDEINKQRNS